MLFPRFFSPPRIKPPVFIVGCGRSGTTIVGTSLSCHPHVTYLNERRDLWVDCCSMTDIWSVEAATRGGRLVLGKAEAGARTGRKLYRLFEAEIRKTSRPVLVEKLPINSFRLEFIHKIFPASRFIHMTRNGVEVARSIERRVCEGWFGANDYKWLLLLKHAAERSELADLPRLCCNDYLRGLLEWRLSTDASRAFLIDHQDACLEIFYEDLIAEPVGTILKALDFIGLPASQEVTDFVRSRIARRSEPADLSRFSESELLIGGELLQNYEDIRRNARMNNRLAKRVIRDSRGR